METIDQNTHLAEELAEIATELQRSFLVELSTEVNRGNISIPQYTLSATRNTLPYVSVFSKVLLTIKNPFTLSTIWCISFHIKV